MSTLRLRHAEDLARHLAQPDDPTAPPRATLGYLEYDEAELATTFATLAAQWQDETGMLSFMHKKALHPAYQRIIGLGLPVVPLILRALAQQPAHWFWALQAITGDDPVPPDATPSEARAAWLAWGRERGYVS